MTPGHFISFPHTSMDTRLSDELRVRRTFTFENLTVDVIENPYDHQDDHEFLVRITVKDENGDLDRMPTLCSCHTRTFASMLEMAADAAEGIEDGTQV